ncbi:hypothetical protein SAMN06296386_10444 [Lachnospiraceae bacterium]|nr:hypothetical protein SAMN06296386_10444 [Lachnospiraceae bacterium]
MKKLFKLLIVGVFVLAMNTVCYASALTDFQAAQAQVAALTAQVQQAAVLAQADPTQAQNYQLLTVQLAQAQQTMQALQPAAAQELQQQQALALAQQQQAQQAAALQAQQAQQAAALQAQQAAALQAQQAAALQAQQKASANDPIVYIPATGDGNRYHTANCRTIKHGVVAVPLSQAQAMGRTPCGVCYR